MCGVIVVDAGRSRSTCIGRDAYIHDHCLGYRHDYLLFYRLPNSNLYTHRMLFSWEKPLVKTMAPQVYLNHITKTLKILLPFSFIYFIFYFCCNLSIYQIQFNLAILPPRDWQPLVCVGCKDLLFVCRYCLLGVVWFSYWFDNLGFITKGNTYLYCAASSLPLRGNTNASYK